MKKIICILSVALVLSFAFVGCSRNNMGANNNNETTQSTQNSQNNDNKEATQNTQNTTVTDKNNGAVEDRDGIIGNENRNNIDEFSTQTTEPSSHNSTSASDNR